MNTKETQKTIDLSTDQVHEIADIALSDAKYEYEAIKDERSELVYYSDNLSEAKKELKEHGAKPIKFVNMEHVHWAIVNIGDYNGLVFSVKSCEAITDALVSTGTEQGFIVYNTIGS